jgi:acetyl esterase/lipase
MCAAPKKEGRAPAKKLEVDSGFVVDIRNYRREKDPRSNQVLAVYPVGAMEGQERKALPVVVFIHGGGWKKGDKDQMGWMCAQYAKRGYFAASISYRLHGESPFPACIQDVKEAIRFIKSTCASGDWPGDVNRIGVMGYSAGAHLSLMLALTPDQSHFETENHQDFDSGVDCAFGVSTPTDFVARKKRGHALSLFTSEQKDDLTYIERVSPLYHIHQGQIPITLVHGLKDRVVVPAQVESFRDRCEALGVDNFELHLEENGGHVYFFKHRAHRKIMDRFFDRHLK